MTFQFLFYGKFRKKIKQIQELSAIIYNHKTLRKYI
jgi:hypothetical protein